MTVDPTAKPHAGRSFHRLQSISDPVHRFIVPFTAAIWVDMMPRCLKGEAADNSWPGEYQLQALSPPVAPPIEVAIPFPKLCERPKSRSSLRSALAVCSTTSYRRLRKG